VRIDGDYVFQQIIPREVLVRIDETVRSAPGVFLVCFPAETNLLTPRTVWA